MTSSNVDTGERHARKREFTTQPLMCAECKTRPATTRGRDARLCDRCDPDVDEHGNERRTPDE